MEEERLRIGKVTAQDPSNRLVRVLFEDVNIVSDWMRVIKNPPFIPSKGAIQQTELKGGGSGDGSFEEHQHDIIISPWFPDINDKVLCIFDSGFSPTGYVLGAL